MTRMITRREKKITGGKILKSKLKAEYKWEGDIKEEMELGDNYKKERKEKVREKLR